ncbi:MAG: rRNA maturation RNase YbeY [Gammaproteobacteria bacterium]|nr:rRNA maturation RNase YbeY [Gammaproteobacteria bacterium]
MALDIQYAVEGDGLPQQNDIDAWVGCAVADEGDVELTVRIVSEEESAELNVRYRGRSGATNVLSFPFDCPPDVSLSLLGDVVICAPIVRQQAAEQGKSETAHWAHLVIHGVLHLLGYDHLEEAQAEVMEAREIMLLDRLGYANPYQ